MARRDDRLSSVLGGKTATALAKAFDLHTVDDLLRHYPRRYAERGELTDLSRLEIDEQVTVLARVESVTSRRMRDRRGSLLEATLTDGRGRLRLTFFNQAWRERDLIVGAVGLFAGKVGDFRGVRQLAHPEYQILDAGPAGGGGRSAVPVGLAGATGDAAGARPGESVLDAALARQFAEAIVPVYPATAGLPSWRVGQAVRVVLDVLDPLDDPLPEDVRARHRLLGLDAALRAVHTPADRGDVTRGRARLTFDEAFALQVVLARRRADAVALPAVPRAPRPGGLLEAFDASLPFALTAGQRRVGDEIAADLGAAHPMHRLLQGEVGSGKTVVALRAMLAVVDAGGQAALLAPTEVLAGQHLRSIRRLLGPLAEAGTLAAGDGPATRIALLTGSLSTAARRVALLDAASGQAGIVVGTHALLTQNVQFADLGLVVVDEQHRFGVEQRDALRAKAAAPPHVLVMTATPIPRTVAMTVYGDLEVSVLDELPAGRSPIATHVVGVTERPAFVARGWARIREEVAAGHQAYVVCPRIGGDEGPEDLADLADDGSGDGSAGDGAAGPDAGADDPRPRPAAVVDVAAELADGPLAGLRVGVLHGRLPTEEKDRVALEFAAGRIDVLVATTVVEVGVDVPNATVMVVLDADRFGVSQLHQLRGRVGRGGAAGLCLLLTSAPPDTPARERLAAVAATLDGFELSRVDLEQRREGDVLGAVQSGRRRTLRLLDVLRHEDVIADARRDAFALVAADPDLAGHPTLAAEVARMLDPERAEFLTKG